MNKYIFLTAMLVVILMGFNSCSDLELNPYNGLSEQQMLTNPAGSDAILNGIYSLLNDHPYPRAWHVMFDWNSDNSTQTQTSGSSSFFFYTFKHTTTASYVRNFYYTSYTAIARANSFIDGIENDAPAEQLQIKGEALFIRSIMHFYLLQAFGRPYPQSPETNLGIIYMRHADASTDLKRNTVKECYDWLVEDFLEAAALMTEPRPNPYGSKEAAYAMLSRVYLYMENIQQAIEYANLVINSGRYELLAGDDLVNAPIWIPENNSETIFCIKKTTEDYMGGSAIGQKYWQSPTGAGSTRVLVSQPLRNALFKHMEDKRIWAFTQPIWLMAGPDEPQDSLGYLLDEYGDRVWKTKNGLDIQYVLKYSNQENNILLCSPVVTRLAEMYLNRAEANAKLGNAQEALDDVNLIRERAGLSGDALYTLGDLQGFENVLDVVLEERRLELMFEGHRSLDLWRNGKTLDRDYPGVHRDDVDGLLSVPPDHPRIVLLLPEAEIILNPNIEQNP